MFKNIMSERVCQQTTRSMTFRIVSINVAKPVRDQFRLLFKNINEKVFINMNRRNVFYNRTKDFCGNTLLITHRSHI